MTYKREDFPILCEDECNLGYYICTTRGETYMHKDGTVHTICGLESFFRTKEEAQATIDKYYPAPVKRKAYRFDSREEKESLVKKFGEKYFEFVELKAHAGYLYQKGDWDDGGRSLWTSASQEEVAKSWHYSHLTAVSFKDAMKELVLPEGIPPVPEPAPEGYHYEERGWGWKALNVRYITFSFNWDLDDMMVSTNAAGVESVFYVEIVKNEEPQEKMKEVSIKEQIDYANSLVGKRIYSSKRGSIGIVSSINILTSLHDWDCSEETKTIGRSLLFSQGCIVTLVGVWDNNRRMVTLAHPTRCPKEIYEILIEDVGEYKLQISPKGIKVGCTSISFEKFDEIAKAVAELRP